MAPVFFSEKVDAAVAGKSLDDQLTALGTLIQDAQHDKDAGYGPPAGELHAARRKWLGLYDTWAANNLEIPERKFA